MSYDQKLNPSFIDFETLTFDHEPNVEIAICLLVSAYNLELYNGPVEFDVDRILNAAGARVGLPYLAGLADSTMKTYLAYEEIDEEFRVREAEPFIRTLAHIHAKRHERSYENQIVDGFGYSQWEMKCAFEKVANPLDWKAPIAASYIAESDIDIVCKAIRFFTATEPYVFSMWGKPGLYSIKAIGYRRGPAGDH